MADFDRIKGNIATMASKGASDQDIEMYVKQEGVTEKEVKDYHPESNWMKTATAEKPVDRGTPLQQGMEGAKAGAINALKGAPGMVTDIGPELSKFTIEHPKEAITAATAIQAPAFTITAAMTDKLMENPWVKDKVTKAQKAMSNTSVSPTDIQGMVIRKIAQSMPPEQFQGMIKGAVDIAAGGGAEAGVGKIESMLGKELPKAGEIALGAAQKAGQAGEKVGAEAGKIWNAGKDIKAVEAELKAQPIEALSLRNKMRDIKFDTDKSITGMTQSFKQDSEVLKKTLEKESLLASEANKSKLRKVFSNMSKTYGKGLESAETALAQKGVTISPNDYLNNVVDPTLQSLRDRGMEESEAFKTIENLKTKLTNANKPFAPTEQAGKFPTNAMSLQDVINFKKEVYDTVSSGVKAGTAYSDANDMAATMFIKNHGQYLGKLSPELAALNKEFAPMAQARTWAMRSFKPYNEQEIQRGANVLSRIASGKNVQTDINYLTTLEKGSGSFKGAADLKGATTKAGADVSNLAKSFKTAKQNLIDATDLKIYQIQNKLAEASARKIELGFERDRLKHLIIVRNVLVGLAIGGLAPQGRKVIGAVASAF